MMTRYYRIDLGADHRTRSKAVAEGCAVLLLYSGAPQALNWFLLVSPGPHPARLLERLRSALRRGERVIGCVRKRDDEALRQLVYSLYRAPGFAGVRRQVGKIVALLRAECKRAGRDGRTPVLPRALPYIARLECKSIPLSSWLRKQSARGDEAGHAQ